MFCEDSVTNRKEPEAAEALGHSSNDHEREDQVSLSVVCRSCQGYITDFGQPLRLRDAQTGEDQGSIPRYGVWKKEGHKMQVVHTTNDLDDAKRTLDEK
jgi:hypothetical protein